MVNHYKDHGSRVDEVLYQEVIKQAERVQELEKQYATRLGKFLDAEKKVERYRESIELALDHILNSVCIEDVIIEPVTILKDALGVE